MARIEIRVSDLTRQPIEDESQVARLIVEHPDYPEPIGLDVLPQEIESYLDDAATRFVVLSLETPDNPQPDKRYAMAIEDFDRLFQDSDSQSAIDEAYAQQQEQQRQQQRSRRKGAGKREGRQRQQRQPRQRRQERIDYTSPEHAGEPHRGTVSEEEKRYVRENLMDVNRRLEQDGHRTIDPNDPEMAARYGFLSPVSHDDAEAEGQVPQR